MTFLLRRCILIFATLLWLVSAAPASALEASCYGAEVPAPPVVEQTIVLVDVTTPLGGKPAADFAAAVLAAAARPGQRLVILPFAGIAPGETVAREFDEVIEGSVFDESVINSSRIGPFKRSQRCVRERHARIKERVAATLAALRARPEQALGRSEIVYALRRTIADFARPGLTTVLMVFSDGLQNGSGMSFYKAGQPRDIDPARELRLLLSAGQDRLAQAAGPFHAYWWGLLDDSGVAGPGARSRYRDVQMLDHYAAFWRRVLMDFGAQGVDIGPTLNNPDLRLVAKP